jgi:predicted enzyme related to lactoylglutathione lyase
MTTDWKAAFEFYQKLFGWEKQSEMDMGGGNMYALFGKGKMFGGMFNRFGDMASMPPFWLCYINVKDVGKAVDAATKAGAVVKRPRLEIPGGTIAILGDPQGVGFALHDLMEGAATGKPASSPAAKTSTSASPAKTAERVAKKAAKKSAKRSVKRSVKRSAKRSVKRSAKKAAKRTAKKSAKRSAKKAAKRSAKRTAKKRR